MVTIYNVVSGEAKTLDMVDAREHVASGRWAFTPVKPASTLEPADPVPALEPADPVPALEPADPVPALEPADPVEAKIAALNAAMQKPKAKR